MRKDIVVLGLGNPLMSDEGIGGFLIEALSKKQDNFPDVEFIDAGTGGMSLLHLIADRDKVILVDCAYMNTEPGTIKKFTPQQVKSVKNLAHQSLHEADVLKIIDISRELDQCPRQIIIFGIEPERVELGHKLSDALSSRVSDYLDAIAAELQL